MQTNVTGIFACGNVLHVNDLVDNVSVESEKAGKSAALFAQGKLEADNEYIEIVPGDNVRYVTPQKVDKNASDAVTVYFRVGAPDEKVSIKAIADNMELKSIKRPFVNPGEIESITLDAEAFSENSHSEIVISSAKEQEVL